MTLYVVDTSVAVAWYLPEDFSAGARRWQEKLLEGKIRGVVPTLHFYEFGNVLRTLVRRGQIAADLAAEVYDIHLEAPLELIEPDRTLLLQRALEYDATVYDAVYISLALELDATILTAERTTTPWVTRLKERTEIIAP
ncbi:MAG TPA: type II toxin-antitoxin system VapC family toxin [Thermoanaerobaculia bacterium]|nr:type II toxin-antitoxin system VapC family toxin [Thermoanaerobaculia bacterium]